MAGKRLVDADVDELRAVVRAEVEAVIAEHVADGGPRLLDGAGAARLLGVSTRTLARLVAEGMPHVLVGDARRYEPAEVLRWLRGRARGLRLVANVEGER